MAKQPRVVKVLAALVGSMTAGAIVLMALGHHPPAAGPWSLWTYYRLDPIKQAVRSRAPQWPQRWDRIEVCYTGTSSGNLQTLAKLSGLADAADLNCHFVICNGKGGQDGQILTTERWQRQLSITRGHNWFGTEQTIRISVVADGKVTFPTEFQRQRLQALLGELCRRFQIQKPIYYPSNWN